MSEDRLAEEALDHSKSLEKRLNGNLDRMWSAITKLIEDNNNNHMEFIKDNNREHKDIIKIVLGVFATLLVAVIAAYLFQ